MGKHFVIACLAAGLAAVFAGQAMSSQPKHREYFDYKLEPVVLPEKGGPAELIFSFKMKPGYECDSVLVEVITWKRLTYEGSSSFAVSLAKTGDFSANLAFTIPSNDTSAINIRLSCPNCVQGINRTFITTGDTIQVLDYIPTPLGPEPPREQRIITHYGPDSLRAPGVILGQAMSSQPMHPKYFDYKLEPVVLPEKGGPAELLFSFKMKPEYECDSVLVEVIPWKQLTFKGTSKFKVSLGNTAEFSMTLALTIPPNDTSAIFLRLGCPGCIQVLNSTFITTGDTIQVLDYIPTPLGPEPPREQRIITHYGPDSLRPPKEIDLRKGPDSASMWHEPTEEEIRQKTREARLRQMHEMEKQPLTHLEAQIFTIDSVDYIRRRGETRFHVAEPVKDPWEFSRHLADSVAALPPETECDVVLYLHEAELLELARELTDSLVPSNRADYYLTRTTRGVIKRLSEAGARVTFLDKTPEGTFKPAADTSETAE